MGHSCPKAPGEGSSLKPDWECCHGTGIPRSSQDTHTDAQFQGLAIKGNAVFYCLCPENEICTHL